MTPRVRSAVVVLGLAAGSVLWGPMATPAWAEDNVCEGVNAETTRVAAEGRSLPYDALDVRRAQDVVERFAPKGREPVRVAVLDSGVYTDAQGDGPIPVAERKSFTDDPELSSYHGTAVAGLIAGQPRPGNQPVGIAPGVEIVDVRVYDVDDETSADEDSEPVQASRLAEGLQWVADNAKRLNIKVANVSLAVRDVSGMREAVDAVRKKGVVVVAASGNRPAEGAEFDTDFADVGDTAGYRQEDAATFLFPAGYDNVVAVNSTDGGAEGSSLLDAVLKNSQTDVAVPTYGGISYGINGGESCVMGSVATSWAAAEVSGVVALLWQRYPGDKAQQIIARLVNTASGTTDDPTPLTGAGIVQPYEALTRPLDPSPGGKVEQASVVDTDAGAKATAPEPEPDALASTRENAVWWGLIGGGTLVVALLLRPVLSRRRA